MRTSGKGNEVVMIIAPVALLVGFMVWLAGGPTVAMKLLDGFIREFADFVRSLF